MRELRAMGSTDAESRYWHFKNEIQRARDVNEMDHRVRAAEIWRQAQARFPEEALHSELALRLLFDLRLYDEIEALMRKGQKRYPNRSRFLEGLALLAFERGRWEEALGFSNALRSRHPGCVSGYRIGAACLGALDRANEAEAVFAAGFKAMPEDIGLRIEYAKLAEKRRDCEEAFRRWRVVHEEFEHVVGTVGMASNLKEQGLYDEAEQLLKDNLYRFSSDLTVWLQLAQISERRGNWEEAADNWAIVRKRFPLRSIGYLQGLRSLVELGRQAEAEEIFREGTDRIKDDATLLVEYAMFAHRRGDWAEAALRWEALRNSFPAHRDGYVRAAEALRGLGRDVEAARIGGMCPS
jgi:tetratricopeptide (TPR) repeat protein